MAGSGRHATPGGTPRAHASRTSVGPKATGRDTSCGGISSTRHAEQKLLMMLNNADVTGENAGSDVLIRGRKHPRQACLRPLNHFKGDRASRGCRVLLLRGDDDGGSVRAHLGAHVGCLRDVEAHHEDRVGAP